VTSVVPGLWPTVTQVTDAHEERATVAGNTSPMDSAQTGGGNRHACTDACTSGNADA
jgi:hypothetical protein